VLHRKKRLRRPGRIAYHKGHEPVPPPKVGRSSEPVLHSNIAWQRRRPNWSSRTGSRRLFALFHAHDGDGE
jgi:hypothetical protein